MKRAAAILTLTSALLYGQQSLAVTLHRVRGTIEQVSGDQVTLQTRDGKMLTLDVSDKTKFAGLTKSSLSDIKSGDFIGTATKGPKDFMVALEVVIFPNSMRGTGEGQYPWDAIPDTTQGQTSADTSSTMTNGNVDTATPATASKTASTMTNGNVSSAQAANGAQTITVSYTDPKTRHSGTSKILVPPTAPVVLVHPAGKSVAKDGAKAFVVASGEGTRLNALVLLVGENGVTPPM